MGLPFTETQFLDLFGAFNTAFWPVLAALWLVTLAAVVQILRGRASTRAIAVLAALHWAWSGVVYHGVFFSAINPAAWIFAAVFVVQAAAFAVIAVVPGRLTFGWRGTAAGVAGLVLLIYSLLYPALAVAGAHDWPRAPAFGVPCPTTLFTAGLLLSAVPAAPRWLFVVPVIWSVVAGSAAVLLGIAPDLMLFPAIAAMAIWGGWWRHRPLTDRLQAAHVKS